MSNSSGLVTNGVSSLVFSFSLTRMLMSFHPYLLPSASFIVCRSATNSRGIVWRVCRDFLSTHLLHPLCPAWTTHPLFYQNKNTVNCPALLFLIFCKCSLCVIPFKTQMAKNQEHIWSKYVLYLLFWFFIKLQNFTLHRIHFNTFFFGGGAGGGGFYSGFNTFGGGFYPWFIFLFCRSTVLGRRGGRRVGVGVLRSGSFIRYSRRE